VFKHVPFGREGNVLFWLSWGKGTWAFLINLEFRIDRGARLSNVFLKELQRAINTLKFYEKC
jgi:hypothetical protein